MEGRQTLRRVPGQSVVASGHLDSLRLDACADVLISPLCVRPDHGCALWGPHVPYL